MTKAAFSTLPRGAKGPVAAPPPLQGGLKAIAELIAAWPGVQATTHWHLADQSRADGVDFYVGNEELGHIHLDGSIHLATSPALSAKMVAEGLGRSFPYARGWTSSNVAHLGVEGAVALFRRNYERLQEEAAV